jgi:hypothetical protein
VIAPAAPASDGIADYSYVSAVANCPRYAYYAFELGLQWQGTSLALHLGSTLHAALEVLALTDWDVEAAITAARDRWGDFELPATHKHAYCTFGHVECIIRNYADDRAQDRLQVARLSPLQLRADRLGDLEFEVDQFGFVKLAESPISAKFGSMVYGGKIDYAGTADGEYAIIDNKSTRQWISEHWVQRYAFSHQFRGYLAIMRELTDLPFDRVYINGIYTGKEAADPDHKWANRTTRRSKLFGPFIYSTQHLEETKAWAKRWLQFRDWARADTPTLGADAWPQNDKACFQYGDPCDYFELCKRSPHIREASIKALYQIRSFNGVLASGADSN